MVPIHQDAHTQFQLLALLSSGFWFSPSGPQAEHFRRAHWIPEWSHYLNWKFTHNQIFRLWGVQGWTAWLTQSSKSETPTTTRRRSQTPTNTRSKSQTPTTTALRTQTPKNTKTISVTPSSTRTNSLTPTKTKSSSQTRSSTRTITLARTPSRTPTRSKAPFIQ